jgi:hypothetical protein
VAEVDRAAGKQSIAEVNSPVGEQGVTEVDRAAGKPSIAEVTAVKNDAREVEVQAMPRYRRVLLEVPSDDPDDSVADFTERLER